MAFSRAKPRDADPFSTGRGPVEHRSLALKLLLAEIDGESKARVLDLGAASGPNVAFFGEHSCKLVIADLYRTLREHRQRAPGDAAGLAKTLAEQGAYRGEAPFDVFLLWDLLNYLRRDEIGALGAHLRELARPGSLLFSLVSTRKMISDRPFTFSIIDRETILYEPQTMSLRDGPLYKEPELERLLGGFAVDTTFLLRNGMQEYVMTAESV